MSLSLIGHQLHNGIRNNRAEIASGLVMLPVYVGLITVGIAAALMGVNTELSGCGHCFPLLETKNKCATSAKVIKAIEQPTEGNVSKAFASQINKIHQLNVNDNSIEKYEKRLSAIYSSYMKHVFPETQNINSPVMFSISPESHTLKVHFNEGISSDISEKIKDKINRDTLSTKADKPNNRIKLRFDF